MYARLITISKYFKCTVLDFSKASLLYTQKFIDFDDDDDHDDDVKYKNVCCKNESECLDNNIYGTNIITFLFKGFYLTKFFSC